MSEPRGLHDKYVVFKTVPESVENTEDGGELGEGPLDGCFVLRPAKDPAARAALRAYAAATPDQQLATDLTAWAGDLGLQDELKTQPKRSG